MTTFVKNSFNTASYALNRPTYPRHLFDLIFRYHEANPVLKSGEPSPNRYRPRFDRAVDLGCGTGQASVELTPFKQIIGVDPSEKMIGNAREYVKSKGITVNDVQFRQSGAEELSFIESESVDLITAAQAAHWFNWKAMWPEAARILRPGGTFAFWIYSEFRLPRYPNLSPTITKYSQGTDPKQSIGPYWERPGRTVLDNHLIDIKDPEGAGWSQTKRIYFTGNYYPDLPSPLPTILRKKMTWNDLLGYLRTFSALHNYHEKFPEDRDHPPEGGSLEVRFWKQLMREAGVFNEVPDVVEAGEVQTEVEWPVALVMIKKLPIYVPSRGTRQLLSKVSHRVAVV
jgi:SAM-dependent methyltransferase